MTSREILLFEDNPTQLRVLPQVLEDTAGHVIRGVAWTNFGAHEILDAEAGAEIHADIAIIDGNLGSGAGQEDGKEIVRRIQELGLPLVTVSYSADGPIEGTDYAVRKGDVVEVLNIIGDLDAGGDLPSGEQP